MSDVVKFLGRLAPVMNLDFSEFGKVEKQPLSNIQAISGKFLGRNWVTIPHVTHHDDIDITDVEARRKSWNAANPDSKLTILIPLMKAVIAALEAFPKFNASVTSDGNEIILKRYFNIGVAVDTPNGLLVPVIRGCDEKPMETLAAEVTDIVEKAKTKGLSMAEMSGSSITISSLGHIGGTAFTPIINAPDVAILGVTKSRDIPTRGPNDEILWRTMLPLSLSYDHRVINGVDAAQYVRYIGEAINNPSIFD